MFLFLVLVFLALSSDVVAEAKLTVLAVTAVPKSGVSQIQLELSAKNFKLGRVRRSPTFLFLRTVESGRSPAHRSDVPKAA